MNPPIRLILVDDHPIFRRGLREIVEERAEFEMIGEASDGEEGLSLAAELAPDIIVMDVDMPQLNGLQMARALKMERADARMIFLTMYKDEDLFNAAIDIGVMGYVLKDNASDEIIAALLAVAAGEPYYSTPIRDFDRQREGRVQAMLSSMPQLDALTPSERRILKLISEDRTSKEIAERLKISIKTVENHRLNICNKLDIHGSHSLLKFAFDHKNYL